jgi:hypothetical protein
MGGRCDRPDAAACDYRLTYRSSQMVRTGAAKTKQCCEHMISATTTRELSTGLDESAGKAHVVWTSDCNRRCRRLRSVHARHERTTPRAQSEMVTWWTPGSPAPGACGCRKPGPHRTTCQRASVTHPDRPDSRKTCRSKETRHLPLNYQSCDPRGYRYRRQAAQRSDRLDGSNGFASIVANNRVVR